MSESKITVTRVYTATSARIDPPLDQSWPELKKLRWWAAIAEMDSGIKIDINPADTSTKIAGVWVRDRPGRYDYSVHGSSGGQMSESGMRAFLLGLATGANIVRGTDELA